MADQSSKSQQHNTSAGQSSPKGNSGQEGAQRAHETREDSNAGARSKASSAFESVKESAGAAVEATRAGAQRAAQKTGQTVDATPLAVLVGSLAVGALAGGLLPATRRERDALKPVGKTVRATAVAAASAAKAAGQDRLDTLGFTSDNAKNQAGTLVDGLLKVVTDAGKAAGQEVKQARKQ